MKAKTIKGKSPREVRSALNESMADGFVPALAIVFMPNKNEVQKITDLLDEKGISVFGASSSIIKK